MRFAPTTREIHARRLDAGAFKVCTRDITDAVGPTPRAAIGTSAPSPTRHLTKTPRRAALSGRLQEDGTRPTPPPQRRVAVPIRMPNSQSQKHNPASDAIEAARPSPKGPPETKLEPGPSLRTPLPSRLLCPPPYSLSRNTAHARRQPPVTSDGRPAAPTTPKKSPGPRRAPAPRIGQPKGARR